MTNSQKMMQQIRKTAKTMGYEISYENRDGTHLGFTIATDEYWSEYSSVYISVHERLDGRLMYLGWPQICGKVDFTFKTREYFDREIIGIFLMMLQKGKAAIR